MLLFLTFFRGQCFDSVNVTICPSSILVLKLRVLFLPCCDFKKYTHEIHKDLKPLELGLGALSLVPLSSLAASVSKVSSIFFLLQEIKEDLKPLVLGLGALSLVLLVLVLLLLVCLHKHRREVNGDSKKVRNPAKLCNF